MKLPQTLLVGLSAVALLTIPGPAHAAKPATAEPSAVTASGRYDTAIRFLNSDTVRKYGTSTTIRGQVVATVNGSQGAVAGVEVKLFRKLNGTTSWRYLATGYTSSTTYPHFRFTADSLGNASYRVRFAGSARLQASRNQKPVHVYRPITGRIEDGTGRFHGRVTPTYAHRTIYLDKRSCGTCSWKRERTDLTRIHGRYSFRVGAPRTGRWFWRVSTPATTAFIRSYSGVFTTRLR